YGGREEISDAVRSFLKTQAREGASLSDAIERITPEAIACHLYASNLPDPDLIIRTSGEIRLSGFLLWQSVHSEFYFTDVLWPAFRKVDFLRAIRAYQARDPALAAAEAGACRAESPNVMTAAPLGLIGRRMQGSDSSGIARCARGSRPAPRSTFGAGILPFQQVT